MKKSTKGAAAASAATLLLLAGWGTHATWQAGATVPGTNVATGHLKLNGSCNGWKLGGAAFHPATDLLVPGNILSQHCTFTVDVAGVMTVNLAVDSPSFSNDGGTGTGNLSTILQTGATFTNAGGTAIPTGAALSSGDVVNADITVKLLSTVTDGQDLTSTLSGLTVTASQA